MLKGIILSLSASVLFGYLYYFSTLLQPLGGEDIFGFRIIFTLPFVIAAVFLFKQKQALLHYFERIKQQPLLILGFLFNSAMMGIQIWLFLWAPNNGSALSVSFGYLLLPLVMVLTGRVIFKEYISRIKFFAVVIAAIGVFSNIILKGGLSWEALLVSFGYSTYFATRKILKINDLAGFCIEMSLLLPVCIYFALQVDLNTVQQVNPNILWLLVLLGLISGVALNTYIVASSLLPINVLGLLGYAEPIMMLFVSFLIGEQLDSETIPLFICLMISMLLFISEGLIRLKRRYK
ncbi:EamA family transporter RarD [Pasteurella canis]|uniref:Transporter n=1 Tax=Pasteurella canis TaxID=753 RepID=A0A379EX28_9PAST|nr:EamA family transporter RarD [Pasteurella canis]UAY77568.1 EamA family transporter RarD [Pasteurella canis]UEC23099.1 EamA family transporter RarD [Pasteurella canis]GJH43603.1 putative transporter [Pasteurella canis]SUC10948.1 putative transporter [Pasteurella canis]